MGRIRICPHAQAAELVRPPHERFELRGLWVRITRGHLTAKHFSSCPVKCNPLAGTNEETRPAHPKLLTFVINLQGFAADHRALAHTAAHQCGMRACSSSR